MQVDFPGVTASLDAVIGVGFATRYSLNDYVRTGYCHLHPGAEFQAFARCRGITEPFVGLMTAARMQQTQAITLHDGGLTVVAVAIAALIHPAVPGLSSPIFPAPGTINLRLLIDAHLAAAAMVNAVMSTTETKAQILLARDVRTLKGQVATGTSSNALVVAGTGRGNAVPYAAPVTRVGWLIGGCVRTVLERTLA